MPADNINGKTMRFSINKEEISRTGSILKEVYQALEERVIILLTRL